MTKEDYQIYLQSDHWKKLRQLKINHVGYKCQDCGNQKDIQVHHLKYRKIYNVKLNDLLVLCRTCHVKRHKKINLKSTKNKIFNKKHKTKRKSFSSRDKKNREKKLKKYTYLVRIRQGVLPIQILKELSIKN